MPKISQSYQQLGALFKSLEKANFEEGVDFGENLTGCFKWFISPHGIIFLENSKVKAWAELKANSRFKCKSESWQGYDSCGADINLIM